MCGTWKGPPCTPPFIGPSGQRARSLILSFATLTLGSLITSPAQAQILNGSFETGTFLDNGQGAASVPAGSTAIDNWTAINAELSWIKNSNSYGVQTPYGSYCVDLTGSHDSPPYSGVTQTIATTNGASYHLSFALGLNQDIAVESGPVSVTASAGNTSQGFTFTPALGSIRNQWNTFGYDFTATGASTPITIVGTFSAGGGYIGLDNVSVTRNSPVPEASTTVSLGLLLALGMGGLVVARKRRKA